ncbi:hypothetical protein BOX15_Mlig000989g3 [Macrostomum lignano]|uniref:Amiloride-sensitive sodium channel n=1 Tax=Macrostomum lignano TaxID=282301 RepID=A0A267FRQ2_9PLAT|nr:hypothetical protein BOX15_Mlig000989g3 [Macrostomum lignano]
MYSNDRIISGGQWSQSQQQQRRRRQRQQAEQAAASIAQRLHRYRMLDDVGDVPGLQPADAPFRSSVSPALSPLLGDSPRRADRANGLRTQCPAAAAAAKAATAALSSPDSAEAACVYPNPWVRRSDAGDMLELRPVTPAEQPPQPSRKRQQPASPAELQDLLAPQQPQALKPQPSFLEIVRVCLIKYCQTTSLRGVPKVVKTKEKLLKGIWATFVLAFFLGCLTCLGLIIKQYMAFDVIHQPKTVRNFSVQFPSFTVCNTRPLSQQGIEYINQHRLLLPKKFSERVTRSLVNTRSNMAAINQTFNETVRDALSTIFDTKGYYENMPPDIDVTQFGHTLDETIILCETTILIKDFKRSMFCDKIGSWTQTYDNKFLNCYSFTAHANFTKQILTMRIMAHTNERNLTFCPDCSSFPATQVSGLRVQLHNAGNYPEVQEEGLNLKPGSLTEIRFETKEWSMKTPPHGRCSEEVPPSMKFRESRFTYSYQACKKKILHEQIHSQCGCLDSTVPLPDTLSHPGSIYCGRIPERQFSLVHNASTLTSDSQLAAAARAVSDFYGLNASSVALPSFLFNEEFQDFLRRVTCNMEIFKTAGQVTDDQCFTPCTYYTYETTISTTNWPTKAYLYEIVNDFQQLKSRIDTMYSRGTTGRNSSYLVPILAKLQHIYGPVYREARRDPAKAEQMLKEIDYVQSNFIEILINRGKSNFDIERIEEKAVISLTSLLSQIGGLLSIWVGLTFVCIVEIIELLYNIVTMCAGRAPLPGG